MIEMRWVERVVDDHTVLKPQIMWVLQYRELEARCPKGLRPKTTEWTDIPYVKPEDE